MPEFLPEWAAIMSTAADGTQPQLRPGVSTDEIAQAEADLGVVLPGELKAFYSVANGIDWCSADYQADVLRLQGLRFASEYTPSLSVLIRQEWETYGRDAGEQERLSVFSTGLVDMIANAPEQSLPFDAVDAMLLLQAPARQCAVLVLKPLAGLAAGSVLEIEGYSATHHESIRAWLASVAASITMVNDLGNKHRPR